MWCVSLTIPDQYPYTLNNSKFTVWDLVISTRVQRSGLPWVCKGLRITPILRALTLTAGRILANPNLYKYPSKWQWTVNSAVIDFNWLFLFSPVDVILCSFKVKQQQSMGWIYGYLIREKEVCPLFCFQLRLKQLQKKSRSSDSSLALSHVVEGGDCYLIRFE
jgi:hypothetical protein